tara:strand:- start:82 stop:453 length:372 start_codon:yes stop_codon:yes gene_type:complete
MLTTTGIIVMTLYTVAMLYSIVTDTTRKTSQRIGKILLSIGEGILLYTASIWFLVLSLGAITLSILIILYIPSIRQVLDNELSKITVATGQRISVNKVVALTGGATAAGMIGLYGVMATWGIA